MDREQKEKKPYSIRHLWHWYFGNYCAKKCRTEEELAIACKCWDTMETFCDKNKSLKMKHKEFVSFFAHDMNVCKFNVEERKRMPTWKEVLSKEPECKVCKRFGIKRW